MGFDLGIFRPGLVIRVMGQEINKGLTTGCYTHGYGNSILQCVENHTTALVTEGNTLPDLNPKEIDASQPDHKVAKKSKASVNRKASATLPKSSGVVKTKRKKKLNRKASEARSRRKYFIRDCLYAKPKNMQEDQSALPYFSNTTSSGPDYGATSNTPNVPSSLVGDAGQEASLSTKETFKDQNVCKKDLGRTINPAELERTKAMSPLELSNRMNVLTSLLVAKLRTDMSELKDKYEMAQEECHCRYQENKEFQTFNLVRSKLMLPGRSMNWPVLIPSFADGEQCFEDLQNDVTRFVSFDFDCLVRKLLPSDEFNVALAYILSLGINTCVEKGMRIAFKEVENSLSEVASLQPDKLPRPPFLLLLLPHPLPHSPESLSREEKVFVPSLFDAFEKHWKGTYVTWAQLEKKQDEDATLQDFDEAWIYIVSSVWIPPYQIAYLVRKLTMDEIMAKFINKRKREHEEMETFIREFRTTNEILLREQNNLLSELRIKVHELSRVIGNTLSLRKEAKGVTTRGGKMTAEVTNDKEINETNDNHNKPSRFQHNE
uniref:Retrotransposon Gag protein n=1 Tax=Tanacetum cinerariifolium TaxID=118510 RepID=A0A699GVI9_TANCI|nr:retrotransposon Gag protein [Tanacetum cinerariifolium]